MKGDQVHELLNPEQTISTINWRLNYSKINLIEYKLVFFQVYKLTKFSGIRPVENPEINWGINFLHVSIDRQFS